MKYLPVMLTVAMICQILEPAAYAAAAPDRSLAVEAEAEAAAPNDSVQVTLAVLTQAKQLEQASTENVGRTQAVMEGLRSLRIPELKLSTADFTVNPQWDYEAKPPRLVGYEVRNAVEARLESLAAERLTVEASRLIETALAKGANGVAGLAFYIRDSEKLHQQALAEAAALAKTRAEVLARAAGVRLGKIIRLSMTPAGNPPVMFRMQAAAAMEAQSAPPLEAGEGKSRMKVSVEYGVE